MHTQGEWEINPKDIRFSINCGDKHIAMVNCYNAPQEQFRVTEKEAVANAKLIAAAPKTAKTAEKLVKAIQDIRAQQWGMEYGGKPGRKAIANVEKITEQALKDAGVE